MASAFLEGLRRYSAEREVRQPRPEDIHIAICVPDEKLARKVQRQIQVITPKRWLGRAKLHVLIGNETNIDDQTRVLLASLRIVSHKELGILHDTETEIGWTDLPRPTTS